MKDVIQDEKTFKAKLEALSPLPEGVEDIEIFIEYHNYTQSFDKRIELHFDDP